MDRTLANTPLHDTHIALGGKMVPFAGYAMPVQYPAGIRAEHAAVRTAAGLFDVSHMGEFTVRGPQAEDLVQYLTVNDVSRVAVGQAQYSALCNGRGTILDDLLVYRFADRIVLVVNASNRARDWDWVTRHASGYDVEISDDSDDIALIALQGPASQEILAPLTAADLGAIGYYRFAEGYVAGAPATISRTGYTGEDGFELYLPAAAATAVWNAATDAGAPHGLIPAGLGARDSLRLEMGYALYGNDLDEDHTALESGLGWIVKLDAGGLHRPRGAGRREGAGRHPPPDRRPPHPAGIPAPRLPPRARRRGRGNRNLRGRQPVPRRRHRDGIPARRRGPPRHRSRGPHPRPRHCGNHAAPALLHRGLDPEVARNLATHPTHGRHRPRDHARPPPRGEAAGRIPPCGLPGRTLHFGGGT